MPTRSATYQATLGTIPNAVVMSRPVVALPPSSIDPLWDEMRVYAGGVLTSRAFDPGTPISTGYPLGFLTEAGNTITTEAGNRIVTEVMA